MARTLSVADLLLAALSLPVLGLAAYLCLLAALSRRARPPRYGIPSLRFDIIVPAHDEQDGVAATVSNLLQVDYPPALRRVVVVADNCSDATADRARQAGATVIERRDPKGRGKGYALSYAFERCLAEGFADAMVVVDADTTASSNLLKAVAERLRSGASAVQVQGSVLNPDASWRTRLMAIALCLFNRMRSIARERLRLSVGLRGNGMCIASSALREVPHEAHSIVEDLEYGIRLGLAGHRVHYADEAVVRSEMVTSERASRSQRRRWEGGRSAMRRAYAWRLLARALQRRDPVLLDLGMDLLVPPLTVVVAAAGAGLVVATLLSLGDGHLLFAAYPWASCVLLLALYVVRGIRLAGLGARGWAALLFAPAYVTWKLALPFLTGAENGAWIRTQREAEVLRGVVRRGASVEVERAPPAAIAPLRARARSMLFAMARPTPMPPSTGSGASSGGDQAWPRS